MQIGYGLLAVSTIAFPLFLLLLRVFPKMDMATMVETGFYSALAAIPCVIFGPGPGGFRFLLAAVGALEAFFYFFLSIGL
jgi:hypothetical protein